MKLGVLLIAGLIPQAALAQASVCESIANQMDRLACYNLGSSPPAPSVTPRPKKAAATPTKIEKPAAPTAEPKPNQFVDVLADENKKLAAKLKTICRGC